jgi:hypothetical protein
MRSPGRRLLSGELYSAALLTPAARTASAVPADAEGEVCPWLGRPTWPPDLAGDPAEGAPGAQRAVAGRAGPACSTCPADK